MVNLAEKDALAEVLTAQFKDWPARGEAIPHTIESWKYLSELYGQTIKDQKVKIERLTQKNNQLRQKLKQGK